MEKKLIDYLAIMRYPHGETEKIAFQAPGVWQESLTGFTVSLESEQYGEVSVAYDGRVLKLGPALCLTRQKRPVRYPTPYGEIIMEGELLSCKRQKGQINAVYELYQDNQPVLRGALRLKV